MKQLLMIVFTAMLVIQQFNVPVSEAQTPEIQFYALTNSQSSSKVWRLETNEKQAIEVYTMPVRMLDETFESFMPEVEIEAAREYFDSLRETAYVTYETFLTGSVYSSIREIDVSDSGNKVILLITHQTCYPNQLNWNACFGLSQLVLLTESGHRVVWEHAYHDPDPNFLADECFTSSTLSYRGQIISLNGWTHDETGMIVGIGGHLCFVGDNWPYVMVPLDEGTAFTLLKGHTPVRSPEGNQWASISRSCETSLDCTDSLVIVDVTDLEKGTIGSNIIPLEGMYAGSIQWNGDFGIQFRASDQLHGYDFLASVDLETRSIEYLPHNKTFSFIASETTRSLVSTGDGTIAILDIQETEIVTQAIYDTQHASFLYGPEDRIMIYEVNGFEYTMIDMQGNIVMKLNLMDYFPDEDQYTKIKLAW